MTEAGPMTGEAAACAPDDSVVVRLERASLGYGRRVVLKDVDLAIRAGEFWCLLGPNGAGKSTLLWTLLGLRPVLAGSIHRDPQRWGARSIGFVPQRCALNASLPTTVREFVGLGRVGLRATRAGTEQAVVWALAEVGLAGFQARDYWQLSGGQRQRALVARALARRPRVLVLDEPTNGLDVAAEDALLRGLDRLHRDERLTVLLVTHQVALAARWAQQVALFRDGGVSAGPRDLMLTADALARTYGVPIDVHAQPDGGVAVRVSQPGAAP